MPETQAPVTAPPATTTTPPVTTNGATPPLAGEPLPVTPPLPKEEPMGKRFAALSRKEKELLTERQAIAAERAALNTEKESITADKTKMQKLVSAVANAKENPLAILQEAGVTYDELTKFILKDGKVDPQDRISELDKKIEDERIARIAAEEARELKEQTANDTYISNMINEYHRETNEHIAGNPDAYELIIAHGAENEVFLAIRDHFAETGEIMSPEDAAKKIESELEAIIEGTLKLKKVQAKLKPSEPEPKKTPEPTKTLVRPVPKSLSVEHVSAPNPKPNQSLTERERMARAMGKLVFTDR